MDYHSASVAFERAVKMLQNNLQYLADQDKVSTKFIALQNHIIKILIDYQRESTYQIQYYEERTIDNMMALSGEYQKILDIKESFEAICIIHGIMDMTSWLGKGKDYLVQQAVECHRAKMYHIPDRILDKISKLPEQNKTDIQRILGMQHPLLNEINQLLEQTENKIKNVRT
ncbi:MAG: hypothetical protein COC01_08605 [Bacteroidetes bacterium]|nr:MAG: hypothetical protein COC01_08605 [Bacteroidota bacterium]